MASFGRSAPPRRAPRPRRPAARARAARTRPRRRLAPGAPPRGPEQEDPAVSDGLSAARAFFLRAARTSAPQLDEPAAPAQEAPAEEAPAEVQEAETGAEAPADAHVDSMTLYATLPSGRAALRLRGVPRAASVGALRRAVLSRLPGPLQRSAWVSFRGTVLGDDGATLVQLGVRDGDSLGVHVPAAVGSSAGAASSAGAGAKPGRRRRPASARRARPATARRVRPATAGRARPVAGAARAATPAPASASPRRAPPQTREDDDDDEGAWNAAPPRARFAKEERWPGPPEPVSVGRRDHRRLRGVYGDLNQLKTILRAQDTATPEAQFARMGLDPGSPVRAGGSPSPYV